MEQSQRTVGERQCDEEHPEARDLVTDHSVAAADAEGQPAVGRRVGHRRDREREVVGQRRAERIGERDEQQGVSQRRRDADGEKADDLRIARPSEFGHGKRFGSWCQKNVRPVEEVLRRRIRRAYVRDTRRFSLHRRARWFSLDSRLPGPRILPRPIQVLGRMRCAFAGSACPQESWPSSPGSSGAPVTSPDSARWCCRTSTLAVSGSLAVTATPSEPRAATGTAHGALDLGPAPSELLFAKTITLGRCGAGAGGGPTSVR